MKSVLILFLLMASFGAGQYCWDNTACPPGYYCQKVPGDCAGIGIRSPKPGICFTLWDPVCGCDGITYGNSCEAAAAGVNVAYAGPCMLSPCQDNEGCPSRHYCAKPTGDCSAAGICTDKPLFCPDIWEPVCGCDYQTYGNACEAAAAGANVLYEGPCIITCVNPPLADLNGDCWVDLQDLALLAGEWLICGLDIQAYCFRTLP